MNEAFRGRLRLDNQPGYSLAGFGRNLIRKGETVRVSVSIDRDSFKTVLSDGSKELLHGKYTIYVGGSQPDSLSSRLTGAAPLSMDVEI